MLDFPDHFYKSLLLLNNVIVRENNPDGLFRNLAMTLQSLVRCDRCSLSIYDATTDTLEWFARAEGITITSLDDDDSPTRGPLGREVIRTQKVYLVPDLRELERFDAVKRMLAAGLRWAISLPLISRSQVMGALCISFTRTMTEEDKQLAFFLEKISGQVALAVDNMLAHIKLQKLNENLKQQVGDLLYPDEYRYAEARFFYHCEGMHHAVEQARLLAQSNIPVLICGETGTGKEFIAHFIHNHSPRKNNNFVKVNCPALSSTLFESELFGHAKGAFTGASSQRAGRFELADKGSIFLDEIGELDKNLQAKLLQVLQDACFERVGESRPVKVDVRVISATNAQLEALIRNKEFRQDLYYRLGATVLNLPPLRERHGELPGLMKHVMKILTEDMRRKPVTFSKAAWQLLEEYHWPGNLREFSNLVKQLLLLNEGGEISQMALLPLLKAGEETPLPPDVPAPFEPAKLPAPAAPQPTLARTTHLPGLAEAERELIEQVLTMTNGVVSGKKGAAAILKLPRSTLLYKLRKLGISPTDFDMSRQCRT